MYWFRYSGEVSGISQTFAMMAALISPLVASALTPQVHVTYFVLSYQIDVAISKSRISF